MILLTTGLMGCESLFVSCLDTGIGVYNGLFHSTAITHSFDPSCMHDGSYNISINWILP